MNNDRPRPIRTPAFTMFTSVAATETRLLSVLVFLILRWVGVEGIVTVWASSVTTQYSDIWIWFIKTKNVNMLTSARWWTYNSLTVSLCSSESSTLTSLVRELTSPSVIFQLIYSVAELCWRNCIKRTLSLFDTYRDMRLSSVCSGLYLSLICQDEKKQFKYSNWDISDISKSQWIGSWYKLPDGKWLMLKAINIKYRNNLQLAI